MSLGGLEVEPLWMRVCVWWLQIAFTGEVKHAGHMRAYLDEHLPDAHILPAVESFNTVADAVKGLELFREGVPCMLLQLVVVC